MKRCPTFFKTYPLMVPFHFYNCVQSLKKKKNILEMTVFTLEGYMISDRPRLQDFTTIFSNSCSYLTLTTFKTSCKNFGLVQLNEQFPGGMEREKSRSKSIKLTKKSGFLLSNR